MGPRQELTAEIKEKANIDFYMYSTERFLSYGQSFLDELVNQEALEEIQEMKKSEIEHLNYIKDRSKIDIKRRFLEKEKIEFLESNRNELKRILSKVYDQKHSAITDTRNETDKETYVEELNRHIVHLESEIKEIELDLYKKWEPIESEEFIDAKSRMKEILLKLS